MIDYSPLYNQMRDSALESWAEQLPKQLETVFSEDRHGDFARWLNAIEQLPTWSSGEVELNQARVAVESSSEISGEQQAQTKELLKALHPWRKGPIGSMTSTLIPNGGLTGNGIVLYTTLPH